MGDLVIAMPRTKYQSSGSSGNEPSCSQLIGGADSVGIGDGDALLASQMASRLSRKTGLAVLVSCQLSSGVEGGGGSDWTSGMDLELVAHKAAALAEREILRIVRDQFTTA